MNATFVTTLSTQELQELIESSVRNAVHLQPPRLDNEDDTLLDTKEAAVLIKYEVTSLYGLVKRKKIPFAKWRANCFSPVRSYWHGSAAASRPSHYKHGYG
jgi:hypothetical protein